MKLLANIFSLAGMSLLLISTFSKTKSKMLLLQVGDALFNSIGSLLIGGYSGFITNLLAGIRNLVNSKGKSNKYINILFMILILVIGLCVNRNGLIGLLPILASLEYTLCSYLVKSAQGLRLVLVVNIVLWGTYDLTIGLYTAFIIDIVICLVTIFNLIRYRKR